MRRIRPDHSSPAIPGLSPRRDPSSFSTLLQHLSDQSGPARLMARADARPVIAVKELVEEDQVAPVRIGVVAPIGPMYGTPALIVLQEDSRQPARQLGGHVPQSQELSGT